MLKIITTGINAGCYSATFTEYKTINELLQAVGVRSRLVSMMGNDVVFQAENVYKALINTEDRARADALMTPDELKRYKL